MTSKHNKQRTSSEAAGPVWKGSFFLKVALLSSAPVSSIMYDPFTDPPPSSHTTNNGSLRTDLPGCAPMSELTDDYVRDVLRMLCSNVAGIECVYCVYYTFHIIPYTSLYTSYTLCPIPPFIPTLGSDSNHNPPYTPPVSSTAQTGRLTKNQKHKRSRALKQRLQAQLAGPKNNLRICLLRETIDLSSHISSHTPTPTPIHTARPTLHMSILDVAADGDAPHTLGSLAGSPPLPYLLCLISYITFIPPKPHIPLYITSLYQAPTAASSSYPSMTSLLITLYTHAVLMEEGKEGHY
jgi:hypothetical protein